MVKSEIMGTAFGTSVFSLLAVVGIPSPHPPSSTPIASIAFSKADDHKSCAIDVHERSVAEGTVDDHLGRKPEYKDVGSIHSHVRRQPSTQS